MSVTQSPPVPFGRHLGVTVRAGRDLLNEVLVREATTYETWIALNLLATAGPASTREALERTLAAGLERDAVAISQLLGQLELFGLIQMDPAPANNGLVEMTAKGEAHYQRLLAAVTQQSARALEGIEPDDLQTTIRVLGQFREQAEALLGR